MVDRADDELAAYTLTRGDAAFVHQHVVDVRRIRTATTETPPIAIVQSLVGLYLHSEHGFDGRQVQRIHKLLADRRPPWPHLTLPDDRGTTAAEDILAVPPGEERDEAIRAWVRSTWATCRSLRDPVDKFLRANGVSPD
jgi:hypothetical protein